MPTIIEENTVLKIRAGVGLNNLSLSSQEAFIISRVDGHTTVGEIYLISLLDKVSTAAVLKSLIDQGVLEELKPSKVISLPDDYKIHEYGSFIFNLPALQEDCELSKKFRKEILFLHENLEKLNHYELLSLSFDVETPNVKKAFLRFSKVFHPDSYFGNNLGSYKRKMGEIYNKMAEAHRILMEENSRIKYRRELVADGVIENLEESEEETPDEKARRLRHEAKVRRIQANPMMSKVNKAKDFYDAGVSDLEKEKWVSAANNFRMAITYDPFNELYKHQLERVADQAARVSAERHYQRGQTLEAYGQDGYMEAYEKAAQAYAGAKYSLKIASLYVDQGEWESAENYAARGVKHSPKDIDARLSYGRILMKRKNKEKAAQQFGAVLKMDPNNETAKALLKEAKRWF